MSSQLKIIVFLGPPGAGKGTQAGLLAQRNSHMQTISTGLLLRNEINSASELGLKVKSVVESGKLVSDDLLFQCLSSQLEKMSVDAKKSSGNKLLILDGVPRNVSQVDLLDTALNDLNLKVNRVVEFHAHTQDLVSRFASRWSCKNCGAVFSYASAEQASTQGCSACHAPAGSLFRRKDDEPESVQVRLKVYQDQTAPVSQRYDERKILVKIDALQPIEIVYENCTRALKEVDC